MNDYRPHLSYGDRDIDAVKSPDELNTAGRALHEEAHSLGPCVDWNNCWLRKHILEVQREAANDAVRRWLTLPNMTVEAARRELLDSPEFGLAVTNAVHDAWTGPHVPGCLEVAVSVAERIRAALYKKEPHLSNE